MENKLLTIVALFGLFVALSLKNPEPKPVVKQTVSVICATPELVKIYIDIYSKQGFCVKQLESQSVTTSVNSRSNSGDAYDYPQRDLYGKFVLVLEK